VYSTVDSGLTYTYQSRGRGSVLLWRRYDTLCTSGLWMTSCLHIMARNRRSKKASTQSDYCTDLTPRRMLKVTHQKAAPYLRRVWRQRLLCLCTLPVAVARCTSGFVDDVTFSHSGRMEVCRCSEWRHCVAVRRLTLVLRSTGCDVGAEITRFCARGGGRGVCDAPLPCCRCQRNKHRSLSTATSGVSSSIVCAISVNSAEMSWRVLPIVYLTVYLLRTLTQ